MVNILIAVSGISGAGKTTLAKELSKLITNCVFMDEDDFFVAEPPKVKLSNGYVATNRDCYEAIDIQAFQTALAHTLKTSNVVVAGFALTTDILGVPADRHFHLVTAHTPQDLEARCIAARSATKKINHDELKIRELVIPFYHATLRRSNITKFIDVFDDQGTRLDVYDIATLMLSYVRYGRYIEKKVCNMEISEPYFTLIANGSKRVEGRKMSDKWKNLAVGDTLHISNEASGQFFDRMITAIRYYPPTLVYPLTTYLKGEGLNTVLPYATSIEHGRQIYLQWSTPQEIHTLGFMAIELE